MSPVRETASQLDRAIDGLLRPLPTAEVGPEAELTATARLLRDALPRLHPSFGFEELLAARLKAAARQVDPAARAAPVLDVLRIPAPPPTPLRVPPAATPRRAVATTVAEPVADTGQRRRRGRVAGGAIASGVSLALPLAGAAFVMWRRSRSSGGIL